jgi:pSer/pThr/pTyr-binding forkhead associated (FHA) protein
MQPVTRHVDPRLTIALPSGEVLDVAIPVGELTIGRTSSNSIVLQEASASGLHAVLRSNGQVHSIVDMGSRNGVFVNGERVAGSRALAHGDRILIGQTQLLVSLLAAEPVVVDEEDEEAEPEESKHRLSPRMRAARIDFVGRIIAQMLTVLAALAISMYLFGSMQTGCGSVGQ